MLTQDFAVFAARFSLTPAQAVWVPAAFENAAKKVGWEVRALVAEATFRNMELGEYIANTIKTLEGEQ